LTPLNPHELGEAAAKGAVWIQKGGKGKILRIRELNTTVLPQDIIQLFFDPKVLKIPELTLLECLHDNENYSIWIKPAGAVPQGSQTGDHASVLRYVEKLKNKEVYLVHRLDRETFGLMIIGHHSKSAALLSDLFQQNKIVKVYEAIVLGELERGLTGTITASLDDKEAITHYESMGNKNGKSLLKVTIETGRLHQIRRHLDHIGHPVMGDPKYGKGNKNREGLKLVAFSLSFTDPWTKKNVVYGLSDHLQL
jgi:tRNA pseudouridine32 synthase/23S rRNA pseudouridine746 synthase